LSAKRLWINFNLVRYVLYVARCCKADTGDFTHIYGTDETIHLMAAAAPAGRGRSMRSAAWTGRSQTARPFADPPERFAATRSGAAPDRRRPVSEEKRMQSSAPQRPRTDIAGEMARPIVLQAQAGQSRPPAAAALAARRPGLY
jgi:hypothetical protein